MEIISSVVCASDIYFKFVPWQSLAHIALTPLSICLLRCLPVPAAAGDAVNLNVVAMALSGYYDNKNTLWRDMCHSLYSRLQHAYLRAMFAFLTCDDDKYDEILVSVGPGHLVTSSSLFKTLVASRHTA